MFSSAAAASSPLVAAEMGAIAGRCVRVFLCGRVCVAVVVCDSQESIPYRASRGRTSVRAKKSSTKCEAMSAIGWGRATQNWAAPGEKSVEPLLESEPCNAAGAASAVTGVESGLLDYGSRRASLV